MFSNTRQECAKPHMRSKSEQINIQHPAITITGIIKIGCLTLLKLHGEIIFPKTFVQTKSVSLKSSLKSVVQAT